MLRFVGCFDGTDLELILRLGRRWPDACLTAGHLKAVGIGALSVYSTLEGVLALGSLSFGSLKKRAINIAYMVLWVSRNSFTFLDTYCMPCI